MLMSNTAKSLLQAEEQDLNLNQRINKVISEIKKLNEEKAKHFGCIDQQSSSSKKDLNCTD